MKKRIASIIIIVSFLMCNVTSVRAEEGYIYEEGIYYSEDGTTVVKSDDNIKVANIKEGPTTIQGKAFWGRFYLNDVSISSTIKKIGDHAFCCCYDLESVVIPSSVETIDIYAFYCDYNLSSLVLSEGVKRIDAGAFGGCALTSVTLPASLTYVSNDAFDYEDFEYINVAEANTKYKSLDGVLYSEDETFLYKYPGKKIGTEYVVPSTVTDVDWGVFSDCDYLESVVLPEGLQCIEVSLFCDCDNLKSADIPESVTKIERYAYQNCDSLETIYIPKAVETIDRSAFWDCNKLVSINVDPDNQYYTSIDGVLYNKAITEIISFPAGKTGEYNIPEGFTNVTSKQFENCDGLTSINIPASVTSIDPTAFSECDNLKTINVDPNNQYYTSVDGVLFSKDESILVCYPAGKGSTYTIPESVVEISQHAFSGSDILSSVTISSGVKKIDKYNFELCNNLTEVILPEGLTTINDDGFYRCENLTSMSIPRSVTSIGNDAFGSNIIAYGPGSNITKRSIKTIYGYKGTYAEQYATDEVLEFVALDGTISTSGVYVAKMDRTGVLAGLVIESGEYDKNNLEYSWWACKDGTESWFLIQDWTKGNEWLTWTPDEFGDYIIAGKVRVGGAPETEVSSGLNVSYHPQIKGKCQMPYTGEGGGYLIGVESYENPNQSYQYEMLVLDCTLLEEGKDAWVYTTGKFTVTEGNAGWTIWQPQYGYYWTLFRVYDAEGNLLDQYCYSFVNAY